MHMIIPIHRTRVAPSSGVPYRPQISIDGEFVEDDMPPLLFDPDEDLSELDMYVQIAADALNE